VPDCCSPSSKLWPVIEFLVLFFSPRPHCILTGHERARSLPRWAQCHHHHLGGWPQGSKASHRHAQLSLHLLCLTRGLCSVGSWASMAGGVWMLCTFVTPETDEQKKENQTPKLLAWFVRYWCFQTWLNCWYLWRCLWADGGRAVPGRVQPRNTEEIWTVCSANRVSCWQRQSRHQTPSCTNKTGAQRAFRVMIRATFKRYLRQMRPTVSVISDDFCWSCTVLGRVPGQ